MSILETAQSIRSTVATYQTEIDTISRTYMEPVRQEKLAAATDRYARQVLLDLYFLYGRPMQDYADPQYPRLAFINGEMWQRLNTLQNAVASAEAAALYDGIDSAILNIEMQRAGLVFDKFAAQHSPAFGRSLVTLATDDYNRASKEGKIARQDVWLSALATYPDQDMETLQFSTMLRRDRFNLVNENQAVVTAQTNAIQGVLEAVEAINAVRLAQQTFANIQFNDELRALGAADYLANVTRAYSVVYQPIDGNGIDSVDRFLWSIRRMRMSAINGRFTAQAPKVAETITITIPVSAGQGVINRVLSITDGRVRLRETIGMDEV